MTKTLLMTCAILAATPYAVASSVTNPLTLGATTQAGYAQTTNELAVLEGAEQALETVSRAMVTNAVASRDERRAIVLEWLSFEERLDHAIDPSFDPRDRKHGPFLNMAPPSGAGRSGIDPRDVKDPALRHEYEDNIRKNNTESERCYVQVTLRKEDAWWAVPVRNYLKRLYKRDASETAELRSLIDAKISSPSRRQRLKEGIGL